MQRKKDPSQRNMTHSVFTQWQLRIERCPAPNEKKKNIFKKQNLQQKYQNEEKEVTKNAQEMVAGWEEESSPFCWCSKAAGKQGVGGVQPMYAPLLMKTSRETVKNVPPKNIQNMPQNT